MSVILLLLYWLCWSSWLISHLLLLNSDLFLNGCLSSNEGILKISCLSFGLSNGHDVFTILIDSWVFSSFLISFFLLGLLILGFLCFLFG